VAVRLPRRIGARVVNEPAARPLAALVGADLRVPLVQGGEARYVNLDLAASAPPLQRVMDRLGEVLPWYASVHRGAGFPSVVCTALYEQARADVHRLAGARPDDVVVFTRNTTDSLNLLCRCLPAGAEVVALDVEHHANLLPWQGGPHRFLTAGPSVAATLDGLAADLRARPASLVALTAASNVTGERLPIADFAAVAHEAGARIAVDAAQLVAHRQVDLAGWDADYVAFSGHKMYAPFGAGVLIGRPDWLDAAPAYLAGGGAVREVTLEKTVWGTSPKLHEGGTPVTFGAVAMAEAMQTLASLGEKAVAAHDRALRQRLLDGVVDLPGVRVLRIWEDAEEPVGIVTFTVHGHDSSLVAAVLSAEHGVGVRDGRFCAHPLIDRLSGGVGAVRASVGVGTTLADADAFVTALRSYLADGPRWTYAKSAGACIPVPDPRPAPFAGVDLSGPDLAEPCAG
jgi:selenocysteine lyase/cysteine desulfurase